MSRLYKDSYGVVWEKLNKYFVWCKETGTGLWDNGRDLTKND